MSNSLILRCPCQRPWARLYNGVLSIDSRHAGKFHTNAIAISMLYTLLQLTADCDLSEPGIAIPAGYKLNQITDHRTRKPVMAIAVLCHERECDRPWAHILGGRLLVDAWHAGEDHRNEIEMENLQRVAPIPMLPEFRVIKGVA